MTATVEFARSVPKDVDVIAVPVFSSGAVPRAVGLSRAALATNGFEGKAAETLVIPAASGPATIAVGIGKPGELTAKVLRDAAAAAVRAAGKRSRMATTLADLDGVEAVVAAQAIVEGALLASHRFAAR
ncbi:MAG: M17 family peptidase N-terminal domain-containing protein, partial [Ilumatobacteraceae bacterium]